MLHNGEIIVIAGITNGHSDGHVTWVDAFNPKTGQWRQLPDAPRARDHFHAAIIDNKIYAAGSRRSSAATGQTFELTVPEVDMFNLTTNTWSTLPATGNIPTPRAGAAVAVVSGKLVVLGGESGGQQLAHNEVEALDPATGTWTKLAPLSMGPMPRRPSCTTEGFTSPPVRGRAVQPNGHARDLRARGQVLIVAQRFTNWLRLLRSS